jgi:hypothetical protein
MGRRLGGIEQDARTHYSIIPVFQFSNWGEALKFNKLLRRGDLWMRSTSSLITGESVAHLVPAY